MDYCVVQWNYEAPNGNGARELASTAKFAGSARFTTRPDNRGMFKGNELLYAAPQRSS